MRMSDVRLNAIVWDAGYCDHVDQLIHDYVECVIDHSHASRYHDSSKRSSVDQMREMEHGIDEAKTRMLVAILSHCRLSDGPQIGSGTMPASAERAPDRAGAQRRRKHLPGE